MDQAAAAEAEAIGHKAYARIGLLGNQSDVHYGNTISPALRNFCASVSFEPSEPSSFVLTHFMISSTFNSLEHLARFYIWPHFSQC